MNALSNKLSRDPFGFFVMRAQCSSACRFEHIGITVQSTWMNDELRLLDDAAQRFFEQEFVPHKAKWNKQGVVDREAWPKAGAAGSLCAAVPEESGGGGGDYRHEAVITEAQLRCGLEAFGSQVHSVIVVPYVLHYGTEAQRKRWLPRLATGELVGAIAMTEPNTGSDLQSVGATAIRDGDEYVLNGAKTYITNGQTADFVIVVAKTDPKLGGKGISLLVVETDNAPGFERGRNLEKVGLPGADTSELFFRDVRVPADNLLGGEEGRGFVQLMQQLPQERLSIAQAGVVAMERAVSITVDYVRNRKAFGQTVLDFQNTQFKLAECKTKTTVARAFVDQCVEQHVRGELDATTASMAKYWVTDTQCEVIDECVQLHGGAGYMLEYDIGQMYQDARVQRIYGGTNEIMKVLIARSL